MAEKIVNHKRRLKKLRFQLATTFEVSTTLWQTTAERQKKTHLEITSLQVGVLQAGLLVPGESPLLFLAVGITVDEFCARDDAGADGRVRHSETLPVGAAVPQPLGGGVVSPAARAAAVGDGGR